MKLFKYFRVLEDIVSKGMKEFNEIYINAPYCMNLSAFKVCVDYKANKESEYTFSKRMLFWLGFLCGDRNLKVTENLKTAATRKHQLWCRPDIEVPQLAFDIECKLFSLLQKKFEDDLVKILMLPYWLIPQSGGDVGLGALCDKNQMYFIGCKQVNGMHNIQILAAFPTTNVQGMCKIFLFIIDYFVAKGVFQNNEVEMMTQFFDKYNNQQFSLATQWYEN